MAASSLRLLGTFQLETPFSCAPLRLGRKSQALLTAVALQGGAGLSRAKLITLLWADQGDEEARGALRQCLHLLRRTLGAADLLESDGDRLLLSQRACEVDVIRFEALAASHVHADWQDAAALYRGDFIEALDAGSDFERWAGVERERLRNVAHGLLERLSRQAEDVATRDEAVRLALRLLASDPVHEGCWRALMRLYAGAGLRAKALQTWNECRDTLRRELGVEPSAETAAALKQLCSGVIAGLATPVPSASPAVPFVPVVSAARSGDDPRVVDLNLRGWEQYVAYTPEGNLRARAAFEQAVRLAGDHAEVIARVGWTYFSEATSRWTSDPGASLAQASHWASRAIACNRGRSTPHSLMGKVLLWQGEHEAALDQFRVATRLEPNYSWTHFHLADGLAWSGDCDDSLAQVERALALDQNDHGMFLTVRGLALWLLREHRAARLALDSALTRNPGYAWAAFILAAVHAEEGDLAAACAAAATARRLHPCLSVSFAERVLPIRRPEHRRRMVDGLRACGMPRESAPPPQPVASQVPGSRGA